MTELSDKEKALVILEKSRDEFNECTREVRKLTDRLYQLTQAFDSASTMLKRCLNEEGNGGNIHKDCKYYDSKKDYCMNYLMGKYSRLAFNVSKNKECIKDLVNE